jgi:mannose-1-phosphate guanylyltransferase
MLAVHRKTGAAGTILLVPVEDPSRYGLVRCGEDGRVHAFVEKPRPEEVDTNLINAGLYVLEPEVLELIPPGRPISIERDVFPRLVGAGSLYGFRLDGYWRDIGTPESYLHAHHDVLERNFTTEVGEALGDDYTLVSQGAHVSPEARLVPPVFVGAGASIAAGARIGSLAVVGPGAQVAENAVVEGAVVGARATVGADATVAGSILGHDVELGAGCDVRSLSVVGPGARIGDRNMLDHGIRIAAGETIAAEALRFS